MDPRFSPDVYFKELLEFFDEAFYTSVFFNAFGSRGADDRGIWYHQHHHSISHFYKRILK
jgi:hypothetical protein